MAVRVIDVFKGYEKGENGADVAKNGTIYSQIFNIADLDWHRTDQEVGFMAIADSSTTSTSVTVTFEGSLDGSNFNTGVAMLTTANIADGAADFGSFNVGDSLQFLPYQGCREQRQSDCGLEDPHRYSSDEEIGGGKDDQFRYFPTPRGPTWRASGRDRHR